MQGRGNESMGSVVYVDLLFLINFSMDFLCFFVTARLLHRKFMIWRCILGAFVGGIYSVVILFYSMNYIPGMLADLGVCAIMCLFAFGCADKTLYEFCLCTSVYFGVSAALGGFMTAMYSLLNRLDLPLADIGASDGISVWLFGLLALASGLLSMLGGRFFRSASSVTVADVDITYLGKTVTVRAFVDTGNMLTDPLSGKPVIVVDKRAAEKIMSKGSLDAALNGGAGIVSAEDLRGIRLIPSETASGRAILCAFDPERITVRVANRKKGERSIEANALFAPSELSFPPDRTALGCNALISPELLA